VDASLWIGGVTRRLAGAAARLPWLRWKVAAQATLNRAQATERELSLLRGELAAVDAAFAEARERAKNTAAKLRITENLLTDHDAALARAESEAFQWGRALEGANGELAALRDHLAVCKAALAEVGERAEETGAKLRTTQSLLEERDAALTRAQREADERRNELASANGELADLRKELVALKATPRDPIKRGGHPREPEIKPDEEKEEKIQKRSRTEVMALLENDIWQLYIEDDFSLNGSRLNEVDPGVNSPISESSAVRELARDGALIFRMIGDSSARRARKPSRGLHFIVVPAAWKYVESRSGSALVASGDCGISDYVVHYFSPDRGLPIVFERPDGTDFEVDKAEYRLDGELLPDAEERMGPLLVGNPPYLVADGGGLERVKLVVIGDEGPGKGKWRNSYPCDPQHDGRWCLPDELQRQRIGWYFLRLYDEADNLVESLTFRYVNALQGIRVKLPELGSNSTEDASVVFMHNHEIQVRPADEIFPCKSTQTKTSEYLETRFQWIPDPRIRIARFKVSDGTRAVDIGIEVDRVWWKIINGGESDQEIRWRDSLWPLDVGAFRPTSNTELQVWFPQSMKRGGRVGFRYDHCRRLPAPNADGVTHINLYEFSESPELKLVGKNGFYLWPLEGGLGEPLTLCSVSIMGYCAWCGKTGISREELLTHVLLEHHDDMFEKLYVHQAEPSSSQLPEAIYVCMQPKCGWYCSHDRRPGRDPLHLLERHFARKHPRHQFGYTPIREAAKVREIALGDQKWIWRCKLGQCQGIAPSPGDDGAINEKKEHLMVRHLSEICTIQ
jgi:hypothetical protein